ncbi:MAG: rhodanese-like domain-containing protein [Nitrospira sp.]|nr:rhodanese-like domain-containing protein [Nitrospira sp.]
MKSKFRTLNILLALMALLFWTASSYAADTVANEKSQRIKAEELKALIDKGETFLIVDVRTTDEFMKKHVTGAISVPLSQIEDKFAGLSTETKIAFY